MMVIDSRISLQFSFHAIFHSLHFPTPTIIQIITMQFQRPCRKTRRLLQLWQIMC